MNIIPKHTTPYNIIILKFDKKNKPPWDLLRFFYALSVENPGYIQEFFHVSIITHRTSRIAHLVWLVWLLWRKVQVIIIEKRRKDTLYNGPDEEMGLWIVNETNKNSLLIVDDEKSNLKVLRQILSPEYTVYAAKDGLDAIERAKEHLPDVILLDIIMPEMDGYEVLSALKS